MWLFLASLVMLFLSGMLAYVLIRFQRRDMVPLGAIGLPWGLWVSTVVVIAASVTMHRALVAVRLERLKVMQNYLIATLALAVLFCLVQLPCLFVLWRDQVEVLRQASTLPAAMTVGRPGNFLFGAVIFLICVHAAHVLGGIVALVIVTVRGLRSEYDHESHGGIKHAVMYWHFLDVVWLVMFGTMLLIG